MTKKKSPRNRGDIDKGIHIGENTQTENSDLVGRDRIVYGDEIHGDKVAGDKINGDKIIVGDIASSTNVAVGRNTRATASTSSGDDVTVRIFAPIYRQIESRPEDPNVDKEELSSIIHNIQEEVNKGEQANTNKIERWLKTLALMAPDILDVTVATMASPVTGIATVIRKVVEKAKEEREQEN